MNCSVCGREPKGEALDLMEILRDPRVGTDRETEIFAGSEAFNSCDAPDCGRLTCPEHTIARDGKAYCPDHG